MSVLEMSRYPERWFVQDLHVAFICSPHACGSGRAVRANVDEKYSDPGCSKQLESLAEQIALDVSARNCRADIFHV